MYGAPVLFVRRASSSAPYVLIVLLVAVAGVAVVVWAAPALPSADGLKLSDVQRAEEVGRNRTVALALLAGLLAVIGAIYTARTFALSHRGQMSERFFAAVAKLDWKTNPEEVRLASVYALDAVARESPVDRNAVVNVLRAYAARHEVEVGGNDAPVLAAMAVVRKLEPEKPRSSESQSEGGLPGGMWRDSKLLRAILVLRVATTLGALGAAIALLMMVAFDDAVSLSASTASVIASGFGVALLMSLQSLWPVEPQPLILWPEKSDTVHVVVDDERRDPPAGDGGFARRPGNALDE